jgi:hypothetical protein
VIGIGLGLALLLLVVVAGGAALRVAGQRPRSADGRPEPESVTWARQHRLVLTPASEPFVATYLKTGRQLRRVCGVGGLVVAASVTAATGIDLHVPGLVWILVGYLVGCFWAEVALTRLPAGTRRAASLTPRRVRDHLPRRMVVAQVVFPASSVAIALAALALIDGRHLATAPVFTTTSFGVRSTGAVLRTGALTAAALSVLAMLGVWDLQRYLVGRPRPVVSDDLLAADDAMRISSTHLLSGSGLCIVALLATTQLACVSLGTDGTTSAVAAIGAVLTMLVAWLVFARWRNRPWQVRTASTEAASERGAEASRP